MINERNVRSYHQYQGDSNSCGAYAVAMASNLWLKLPAYTGENVAMSMELHRPIPRKLKGGASFPWGMVAELRDHNIPAHWRMLARFNDMFAELYRDTLIIVIVGSIRDGWAHAKIVFDVQFENGTMAFLDSATKNVLSMQNIEEFKREWNALGRIMITIPKREA